MESRRIGTLQVSVVGLGCNNFGGRVDERAAREVIDAAIDSGVTLLDTADNYGGSLSESFLGRALAGPGRRDGVVLATKFGGWDEATGRETGGSARNVRASLEASLRRLATDRVDLFQLHSPDARTPIAETLDALDGLVKEGKVREIGCSNFSVLQLREAGAATRAGSARFECLQNELSLLAPGDLTQGVAETGRLGMSYLPFFPFGQRAAHREGSPGTTHPVRHPDRRMVHGPAC